MARGISKCTLATLVLIAGVNLNLLQFKKDKKNVENQQRINSMCLLSIMLQCTRRGSMDRYKQKKSVTTVLEPEQA